MKLEKLNLDKFKQQALNTDAQRMITGGGEAMTYDDPRFSDPDRKTTTYDDVNCVYIMKYYDHTGRLQTTITSPIWDPNYPKP